MEMFLALHIEPSGICPELPLNLSDQLPNLPMAPLRRGKEDPFVKFKALWAGVFVEGMESDSEISLSEMDTDLPSTSEGQSEP